VGAIAAIAALRMGAAAPVDLITGAVAFVIAVTIQSSYTQRAIAKIQAGHRPMFPTPQGG